MKELRAYADATCISEPLLGKVTFTSHFIRADYILVAPEANKAKRGYALTISSAMPAEVKELLVIKDIINTPLLGVANLG